MCLLSMGEIISECFKMTNKNEIIIVHCFLWIIMCVSFSFFFLMETSNKLPS